ncbi:9317_t:CDS:2 [Entrophospora sp. SA101]|nr:9317_t:CDS:2 [Entrophospora sp. SA101]
MSRLRSTYSNDDTSNDAGAGAGAVQFAIGKTLEDKARNNNDSLFSSVNELVRGALHVLIK